MSKKDSHPYWLDCQAITGSHEEPKDGGICVIGSGLAGASTAYFLEKQGMGPVTILDYQAEQAATFRNCGHILHGTVESMLALKELHGVETAKEIWAHSIEICDQVKESVAELALDCQYRQDGYLVMAIDDAELREIEQSVKILNEFGFTNHLVSQSDLEKKGFRNIRGGRFEPGSAQAHPVLFRNGLIQFCLANKHLYHSNCQVLSVEERNSQVEVTIEGWGVKIFDAVVIAANAFSPLLSDFYKSHRLVEPFKGQIICSKPLSTEFNVTYPHSFDHGYEYALLTQDRRLMLGGWRNNTPSGEIGTYDITPNADVEEGLKNFAKHHYKFDDNLEWEYSWSGIMATSKTGFPFIGPTNSPLIYTVGGFTGHGFSWAHGSAKLLVDIMAGNEIPGVARFYNPRAL